MTRKAALLGALVIASALCAGCSGPSGAGGPSGTAAPPVVRPTEVTADHNDTDLAYVDRLRSQHQQSLDMVAMVANKDVSAALRALAEQIGRDRTDETRTLRRMGRAWGVPPHPADFHGNPGELTLEQLSGLYGLNGAAFEKSWIRLMADNHLGAVAMSRAELDDGLNLGTREFARGLVRRQESQVERLEALGR